MTTPRVMCVLLSLIARYWCWPANAAAITRKRHAGCRDRHCDWGTAAACMASSLARAFVMAASSGLAASAASRSRRAESTKPMRLNAVPRRKSAAVCHTANHLHNHRGGTARAGMGCGGVEARRRRVLLTLGGAGVDLEGGSAVMHAGLELGFGELQCARCPVEQARQPDAVCRLNGGGAVA